MWTATIPNLHLVGLGPILTVLIQTCGIRIIEYRSLKLQLLEHVEGGGALGVFLGLTDARVLQLAQMDDAHKFPGVVGMIIQLNLGPRHFMGPFNLFHLTKIPLELIKK